MSLTFDDRPTLVQWPFWAKVQKSSVDLGALFSAIPQSINRSTGGPSSEGNPDPGTELVSHFANYITAYLSTAYTEAYVAPVHEPTFGRLYAGREWEEPHYRMVWEPVELRDRLTVYELAIGLQDLCFSAALVPTTQAARVELKAALKDKADLVRDRMWENSLRFLPGADDQCWRAWNTQAGSWGAIGAEKAPERFGVMFEAGPIITPVGADRVSFHISDSIQRSRAVLDCL